MTSSTFTSRTGLALFLIDLYVSALCLDIEAGYDRSVATGSESLFFVREKIGATRFSESVHVLTDSIDELPWTLPQIDNVMNEDEVDLFFTKYDGVHRSKISEKSRSGHRHKVFLRLGEAAPHVFLLRPNALAVNFHSLRSGPHNSRVSGVSADTTWEDSDTTEIAQHTSVGPASTQASTSAVSADTSTPSHQTTSKLPLASTAPANSTLDSSALNISNTSKLSLWSTVTPESPVDANAPPRSTPPPPAIGMDTGFEVDTSAAIDPDDEDGPASSSSSPSASASASISAAHTTATTARPVGNATPLPPAPSESAEPPPPGTSPSESNFKPNATAEAATTAAGGGDPPPPHSTGGNGRPTTAGAAGAAGPTTPAAEPDWETTADIVEEGSGAGGGSNSSAGPSATTATNGAEHATSSGAVDSDSGTTHPGPGLATSTSPTAAGGGPVSSEPVVAVPTETPAAAAAESLPTTAAETGGSSEPSSSAAGGGGLGRLERATSPSHTTGAPEPTRTAMAGPVASAAAVTSPIGAPQLGLSIFSVMVIAGLEAMGPVKVFYDNIPLGIPALTEETEFHPFEQVRIIVPAGAWAAQRRTATDSLSLTIFELPAASGPSLPGTTCGPALSLGPAWRALAAPILVTLPCSGAPAGAVLAAFAFRPAANGSGSWVEEPTLANKSGVPDALWAQISTMGVHTALFHVKVDAGPPPEPDGPASVAVSSPAVIATLTVGAAAIILLSSICIWRFRREATPSKNMDDGDEVTSPAMVTNTARRHSPSQWQSLGVDTSLQDSAEHHLNQMNGRLSPPQLHFQVSPELPDEDKTTFKVSESSGTLSAPIVADYSASASLATPAPEWLVSASSCSWQTTGYPRPPLADGTQPFQAISDTDNLQRVGFSQAQLPDALPPPAPQWLVESASYGFVTAGHPRAPQLRQIASLWHPRSSDRPQPLPMTEVQHMLLEADTKSLQTEGCCHAQMSLALPPPDNLQRVGFSQAQLPEALPPPAPQWLVESASYGFVTAGHPRSQPLLQTPEAQTAPLWLTGEEEPLSMMPLASPDLSVTTSLWSSEAGEQPESTSKGTAPSIPATRDPTAYELAMCAKPEWFGVARVASTPRFRTRDEVELAMSGSVFKLSGQPFAVTVSSTPRCHVMDDSEIELVIGRGAHTARRLSPVLLSVTPSLDEITLVVEDFELQAVRPSQGRLRQIISDDESAIWWSRRSL
jgi:hypothetical protein